MKKEELMNTFYAFDEARKELEEIYIDNLVCYEAIHIIIMLIVAIQSALLICIVLEILDSLNLGEEDVRKLFEKTCSEKRSEKTDNSLEESMYDPSKVNREYKKQEPGICQGKFPIETRAGHIRTNEN